MLLFLSSVYQARIVAAKKINTLRLKLNDVRFDVSRDEVEIQIEIQQIKQAISVTRDSFGALLVRVHDFKSVTNHVIKFEEKFASYVNSDSATPQQTNELLELLETLHEIQDSFNRG